MATTATRSRRSYYRRREWLQGYLFASPFLIGFTVFVAFPMLYSVWLMFQNWDMLSPPKFVGMQNIVKAFTDSLALKSLSNSAYVHALRRAASNWSSLSRWRWR